MLRQDGIPQVITAMRPKEELKRHLLKYAEGELGEDKSFYFRGPKKALNLRAQNLSTFVQLADGVDDETWLHHLRAGKYSEWFRDAIKDPKFFRPFGYPLVNHSAIFGCLQALRGDKAAQTA